MGRRKNKEIITTNYCPQLVKDFETLAKNLTPPEKYSKIGNTVANQIFERLKIRREKDMVPYKVGRIKVAGSMGKNTGISYVDKKTNQRKNSDFDCVVFINDAEPPFKEVMNHFRAIIKKIPNVDPESVKQTSISVQFTYKSEDEQVGEIKFDLLPAKNYVKHPTSENVGKIEAQLALEELKKIQSEKLNLQKNRLFSASFSEKTVELIRKRVEHPYNQKVVRLAKYWMSQLNLSVYVPAKSYITELIAIHSQREKRKRCLISGFRRFLEQMANFDKLVVVIGKDDEGIANYNNLIVTNNFKPPIILDPANPFNNLAHKIQPDVIKTFVRQALKTIDILDGFKKAEKYESVENVIDVIFSKKYI